MWSDAFIPTRPPPPPHAYARNRMHISYKNLQFHLNALTTMIVSGSFLFHYFGCHSKFKSSLICWMQNHPTRLPHPCREKTGISLQNNNFNFQMKMASFFRPNDNHSEYCTFYFEICIPFQSSDYELSFKFCAKYASRKQANASNRQNNNTWDRPKSWLRSQL